MAGNSDIRKTEESGQTSVTSAGSTPSRKKKKVPSSTKINSREELIKNLQARAEVEPNLRLTIREATILREGAMPTGKSARKLVGISSLNLPAPARAKKLDSSALKEPSTESLAKLSTVPEGLFSKYIFVSFKDQIRGFRETKSFPAASDTAIEKGKSKKKLVAGPVAGTANINVEDNFLNAPLLDNDGTRGVACIISDSVENVMSNLQAVAGLASQGKLAGIQLIDERGSIICQIIMHPGGSMSITTLEAMESYNSNETAPAIKLLAARERNPAFWQEIENGFLQQQHFESAQHYSERINFSSNAASDILDSPEYSTIWVEILKEKVERILRQKEKEKRIQLLKAYCASANIAESDWTAYIEKAEIERTRLTCPKWVGRLERGGELAALSAPLFLKRVHADYISEDGTVENETIRTIDPDLMNAVEIYMAQRRSYAKKTGQPLDMKDAEGLNFILSRPKARTPNVKKEHNVK